MKEMPELRDEVAGYNKIPVFRKSELKARLEWLINEINNYDRYPKDIFIEGGNSQEATFGSFGRKIVSNTRNDIKELIEEAFKEILGDD